MEKQYPDTHVITILGMIASGKDYISDLITEGFGIPKTTVSNILREIAEKAGKDPNDRQTLIDISNQLTAANNGDGSILARKTLKKAYTDSIQELQIVGMRQSPQMLYLMQNVGRLTSIFLHTHNQIRLDRETARGHQWENMESFLAKEIEQNTGNNNDLFSFPELSRYQCLPDGSVIDMGIMVDIPESMPKYDRDTHKVLLSQNPDALRELFSKGETIISPIASLATAESQQAMNLAMQKNPLLASENRQRTLTTVRLILGHSMMGYQYLESYARGKQSRDLCTLKTVEIPV